MTVLEDLPGAADQSTPHFTSGDGVETMLFDDDFETVVLKLVKEDPFATIGEIRRDIWRHSNVHRPGWWRVFGVLRRHSLLRKRSRFRFARGRH
jgi:hypothetical protein